jgi:homocitrate synthase
LSLPCLTRPCRTVKIKELADIRPIAIDDADTIIRSFHLGLQQQQQVEVPVAA